MYVVGVLETLTLRLLQNKHTGVLQAQLLHYTSCLHA